MKGHGFAELGGDAPERIRERVKRIETNVKAVTYALDGIPDDILAVVIERALGLNPNASWRKELMVQALESAVRAVRV